MAGKRPKMYYSNNIDECHVYDIVRINRGEFKDLIALCTYVDFKSRKLCLTITSNGIHVNVKPTSVNFCYSNTKSAVKPWKDIIKNNIDKLVSNYSDINYIKDNFGDKLIRNDIVAATIGKIVGVLVIKSQCIYIFDFYYNALCVLFTYKDFDFSWEVIDKLYPNKYNKDSILKIHKAAYKECYESISSPTGEENK